MRRQRLRDPLQRPQKQQSTTKSSLEQGVKQQGHSWLPGALLLKRMRPMGAEQPLPCTIQFWLGGWVGCASVARNLFLLLPSVPPSLVRVEGPLQTFHMATSLRQKGGWRTQSITCHRSYFMFDLLYRFYKQQILNPLDHCSFFAKLEVSVMSHDCHREIPASHEQ